VSYSFGPGEAVEVVTIFPFFSVASALNRRLRGSRHIDPAIASSTHAEQRHFTDQAARKGRHPTLRVPIEDDFETVLTGSSSTRTISHVAGFQAKCEQFEPVPDGRPAGAFSWATGGESCAWRGHGADGHLPQRKAIDYAQQIDAC
jgi:hypothetical protein